MIINIFLLMLHIILCMLFFAEKKLEKYHTLTYKILVYYIFFSLEYLTLFTSINLDWGGVVIGMFLWLSYIIFSVYISIKSTLLLKSIIKPSVLIFCMNFVLFFIISDKKLVNGDLSFSFINILIQSGVVFAFQIPIIIITRIVSEKKSNKSA